MCKHIHLAVFASTIKVLPETKLERYFLDYFGDDSVDELLKRYMTTKSFYSNIASSVNDVIKIATDGDEVALNVVNSFVKDFCVTFIGGLKKMEMLDTSCDIVLAGDALKNDDSLLNKKIIDYLANHTTNKTIINAKFKPVVGACIKGILNEIGEFSDSKHQNTLKTALWFDLVRC
jgi:N-acetylglucosamine kinase-like BadF-type ATPase